MFTSYENTVTKFVPIESVPYATIPPTVKVMYTSGSLGHHVEDVVISFGHHFQLIEWYCFLLTNEDSSSVGAIIGTWVLSSPTKTFGIPPIS